MSNYLKHCIPRPKALLICWFSIISKAYFLKKKENGERKSGIFTTNYKSWYSNP